MYFGKSVSVVFPAYNEEEGIAEAVRTFGALEPVDEVVVVDNNSRDRTAALAQEAGGRVVREERQGYGFALVAVSPRPPATSSSSPSPTARSSPTTSTSCSPTRATRSSCSAPARPGS